MGMFCQKKPTDAVLFSNMVEKAAEEKHVNDVAKGTGAPDAPHWPQCSVLDEEHAMHVESGGGGEVEGETAADIVHGTFKEDSAVEVKGTTTLHDMQEGEIDRLKQDKTERGRKYSRADDLLGPSVRQLIEAKNSSAFQSLLKNYNELVHLLRLHTPFLTTILNCAKKIAGEASSLMHQVLCFTSMVGSGVTTSYMVSASSVVIALGTASGVIIYIVVQALGEYIYKGAPIPIKAIFVFGLGLKVINDHGSRILRAVAAIGGNKIITGLLIAHSDELQRLNERTNATEKTVKELCAEMKSMKALFLLPK